MTSQYSRMSVLRCRSSGGALACTGLVPAASSSEPPTSGVCAPSSRSLATASREAKSVYEEALTCCRPRTTVWGAVMRPKTLTGSIRVSRTSVCAVQSIFSERLIGGVPNLCPTVTGVRLSQPAALPLPSSARNSRDSTTSRERQQMRCENPRPVRNPCHSTLRYGDVRGEG